MWTKIRMFVLTILGLETLPQTDGKVDLSEEQRNAITEAVGEDLAPDFIEKFIEKGNEELANTAQLSEKEKEVATAKQELKALLDEHGISMQDSKGSEATEQNDPELAQMISALGTKIDALESDIAKLSEEPEGDITAIQTNKKGNMKIAHSKTHLFASGKAYDQFAGRPWNQRAAGISTTATEWTDFNIAKVNEDFGDYWRDNKEEILQLLGDYRRLPAHWNVVNNISDEIAYTAIITGEVTQARKKAWLPKNKHKFIPLTGKAYPAQIDLTYEGFDLQKMEQSWLNRFNNVGPHPHKMSFVQFLLLDILRKAREEDNIVLIKGISVPTADNETVAQSFMYRGKGLLKLISEHMNVDYKVFDMGLPTTTNVVEYVKDMCDRLPESKRNAPGLYLYMSPYWIRKYQARRKLEDGLMPTFEPGKTTVEGYPNIMLEQLDFMEGYDLFFITTEDNIEILQEFPKNKQLLSISTDKRDINVFGDYKIGPHIGLFGAQWEDGVPQDYENQIFWSNKVDLLQDVFAPVEPNDVTPSVQYHNAIQVGVNTGATAITNFDDATVGQYIMVKGNGTTNASTMADGGNFDLSGAMTLSENTWILLYVRGAGDIVEIDRGTVNAENEEFVVLAADATSADADAGTLFLTQANSGATAITNIANAVEGEVYTIRGGSDTNATTIAASGNFSRISASITLEEGNEIVVRYNGSKFVELSRVVA